MTQTEQRAAAKAFAEKWAGRGDEKSETQSFWIDLISNIFGVKNPTEWINFECRVQLKHTSFIDAYIPATKVMIEQKSFDIDLNKAYKQSDGSELTPYQQAKRYSDELDLSQKPRWIVVCNFQEFHIHDMEHSHDEPQIIRLDELPKEYHRLAFLTDAQNENLKREMELSIKAGDIVGVLYDKILAKYRDPDAASTLKSLNMLCVRLVFCLYAEDAGIFDRKNQFHDYLAPIPPDRLRQALIDLFRVLDTKTEDRDPYLTDDLAAFPYVNGGLFADESIEIPLFDEEIKQILLAKASDDFDWSEISPTIFGAVFESTLNPETRRSGGMHYTSIENIHKVIDPLFLDGLKAELADIRKMKQPNLKKKALADFQTKLASLTFLDPACGSGNFLTETYLSLRRLENDVLRMLYADQMLLNLDGIIQVSIGQFYGIEINDFAVTVAKTALWIAESQMMRETEDVVHRDLDFLPLKSYANIVEANALRIDWNSVVPKEKLSFIMGNPPFVGARLMSPEQKNDLLAVFGNTKNAGNLDYVSCWYKVAAGLMKNTQIRSALVSTNSITQGEQTALLWKPLLADGIHINFAHRTFRWDSEANIKAHVHCVIVGFSYAQDVSGVFDEHGVKHHFSHINPYLVDAPDVMIESRGKPVCDVPKLLFGNMPNDNGFLSDYSQEQKDDICKKYPSAVLVFKQFIGATEFLNHKMRWCLWFKGISPNVIKDIPPFVEAIQNVRKMREQSKRVETKKLAETPMLFGEIRQPENNYILVPRHSSENRKYVPIGFISPNIIAGDANFIIPDATLYHFGILTSSVHMAWMRTVCGRLEMRYRYSKDIVYNNFPWPEVTDDQKEQISATAQGILDARAQYPDCSLADLYDETTMPPELRRAHQANDKAVLKAYGFAASMTEPEIVAELMNRYRRLTAASAE